MRVLTHTVIEAEAGQPVKQLLLHLWGISGSFLSRLKFRQAITVNGAPVTVRFVPCPGDVLAADISDLPGEHPHIRPVDFPLDILYEDEDLLLINKPAGIAVHPAALTEETATIAGAAAHYLHSESFHAVNRLDRGTTGGRPPGSTRPHPLRGAGGLSWPCAAAPDAYHRTHASAAGPHGRHRPPADR
ncbi:MAG: hypothetical protein KHW98_06780 [Firmicutes bacterium]|nr:hypothetical protein [Bacillota bacterium]